MISKNKLKQIQALSSKKQRSLRQEFLIEGPKLLEEAIKNNWKIMEVLATEEYLSKNTSLLKGLKTEVVNHEVLQKTGNLESNKYVSAIVQQQTHKAFNWKNSFSLVIDQVQDPGNLGTILRTASWFGIQQVICSQTCVELYNPKVVQSSMGAIFNVNISYRNLTELCAEAAKIKDFPIFGAFLNGSTPAALSQQQKGFLIVGNESHGISDELTNFVNHRISIPRSEKSNTESLNVAIATSILCYELNRP